jgi:putative hemolysin
LEHLSLYLALLIFFLLLSVFFSASETAYMVVDRLRLKYLAESGDKSAAGIKRIVSNPDRLLGVILLGNNIANIAAASLVTYVITSYVPDTHAESASLIGSVVLTLVVLIFCELTPKIIAASHSEHVSRRLLWPIQAAIWALSPLARVAAVFSKQLVRLFGFSPGPSPFAHALSEEEIRAIIASSTAENIESQRKEMLSNVFEIGATQVRDVMIPRVEVTAVEIREPISNILSVVRRSNYSRIPVYRENFENIVGILNVKDLLQHLHNPGAIDLQVLLRPVHFVPDTARLDAVLRQLQSMHLHMAVVVDEYGGVEGIVTLEDLLEEIVGEIRDEHDTEIESVCELGQNLFSIAGNLPVKDFNRLFSVKIPESRDYATVVGFLESVSGRLLQEGDTVHHMDLTFYVERVKGFRIESIRLRVPPAPVAETVPDGAPSEPAE